MTNAQKWVSIFLFLFVLLLILSNLTERNESETYEERDEPGYSQTESDPKDKIQTLLTENQCISCHGESLNGSNSGPSLSKVSQKWTKNELAKYLQNPRAFKDDPRVNEYKGKYRFSMPPVNKLNEDELNILVDYLITEY